MTCANLGDSRCVIDNGLDVICLTDDHRVATNQQERRRVEHTGALIAPVCASGTDDIPHKCLVLYICACQCKATPTAGMLVNRWHHVVLQVLGQPRTSTTASVRCASGPVACACPGASGTLTLGTSSYRGPTSCRYVAYRSQGLSVVLPLDVCTLLYKTRCYECSCCQHAMSVESLLHAPTAFAL